MNWKGWPLLVAVGLLPRASGGSTSVPAPAAPAPELRLAAPLGTDPAVVRGRLPNGLRYFLRKNARPERRAAVRLAVNVGSVVEEEDQRGLAHFLEHMAFNGSKHFRAGEMVSFFESAGARFGPDANAFTSFDETVYVLDVPTDREGVVEKALLALSDVAGRADLDEREVEKERGVVLEEWRLGQGASTRILRQQLPVLYHGSRYAERLPIGDPEVLRSFPAARLRDFYRAWYRPENMAVVVVGDLDPARAEKALRKAFGDLPARPGPPVPAFPVPGHAATLSSVASDPEARGSAVSVVDKVPQPRQETVGDYRRLLVESLFHEVLNERLGDLARRPDAPFLAAASSSGRLGPETRSHNLSARVPDGGLLAGLRSLLVEGKRVLRHGFSEAETERARRRLLAGYERAGRERDKSEHGAYAREYVSHFLEGEAIPGIDAELAMARAFLPGVTRDELLSVAREFLGGGGRAVLAVSPRKEGLALPGEEDLRAVVEAVGTLEVTPWADSLSARSLMEQLPEPGRVVERRQVAPVGATVVCLSNGVEAWLKPTNFKNDEVVFSAYALGGASLAREGEAWASLLSASAVAEAGVGGFTPVELEKLLSGKILTASPYVGLYTHGLTGTSTPADLETALQVVHLELARPDDRPEAFEVLRRRLAAAVANRASDPNAAFADAVRELNTGGHPLYRPLRPGDVEALDREVAMAAYRARFANAADLTFFFVGAFDVEAVLPLLERYLGSLPSTGARASRFRDPGLRFPAGTPATTVRKGSEPRSVTTLSFFADPGFLPEQRLRADVVAAILQTRLRGVLRERLSQTYGASVSWDGEEPLPGFGVMSVSFGSDPRNADAMVETVLDEIGRLQALGPPEDHVRNEQEIQRRELEVALRRNSFWLSALQSAHLLGLPPDSVLHRRDRIDRLDRQVLRDAFRRYFPRDRFTRVTLLPATGAGQGE